VFEFERGLKYSDGRFVGTLGPGRYWAYQPQVQIRKVDVRPRFVTIGGQEVLSSDGVTLKVSLAVEYEITDPELASTRWRALIRRCT
jgi:regulator of protease activity HflC (stomatin/prohibitin superfamily)